LKDTFAGGLAAWIDHRGEAIAGGVWDFRKKGEGAII